MSEGISQGSVTAEEVARYTHALTRHASEPVRPVSAYCDAGAGANVTGWPADSPEAEEHYVGGPFPVVVIDGAVLWASSPKDMVVPEEER